MAHLENYAKKDLRNLLREHERSLRSYANKVDKSQSDKNYGYGHLSTNSALQAFNRRVTDIMDGRDIQEKTNICSEWVISCPLELIASGREKSFFDECWRFAEDRYGKDNMISGFVHMDETRPHMHMMLVPEATSRKTGKRTVSSASLMTRAELSKFHTDLNNHCEIAFGQKNLIKNGKTIADGVSIRALGQIQEDTKKQFAKEINSYRKFLASYTLGDKSLLEIYEEKQKAKAAAAAPTEAPTAAPAEAPQKPTEAPMSDLPHRPKTTGKTTGKKPVSKPSTPPDNLSSGKRQYEPGEKKEESFEERCRRRAMEASARLAGQMGMVIDDDYSL